MDTEIIHQFCSITGSSEEHAVSMLESVDGALDAALAQHFAIEEATEVPPGQESFSEDASTITRPADLGLHVPADGRVAHDFVSSAGESSTTRSSRGALRHPSRRRSTRFRSSGRVAITDGSEWLDENSEYPTSASEGMELGMAQDNGDSDDLIYRPFRRHRPEENLMDRESWIPEGIMDQGSSRVDDIIDISDDQRPSGLESIFAPPYRLAFRGTFSQAMQHALATQRWLLINVQRNGDFASMVLNRDVWHDVNVESVVGTSFVLWQQTEGSAAANEYTQFYSVASFPHIAVLDPRTGERLRVWENIQQMETSTSQTRCIGEIEKDMLMEGLLAFLDTHSLDDATPRPHPMQDMHASSRITSSERGHNAASGNSTVANHSSRAVLDESDTLAHHQAMIDDDDALMAAAIAASLGDEEPSAAMRHSSRIASMLDPKLSESRMLRATQDAELEASMAADRAREREEQTQKRPKTGKEEMDRNQSVDISEENVLVPARGKREHIEVPPEPPSDGQENVVAIAIRLPNGERLQRKFCSRDKIQHVFAYVEANCSLPSEAFVLMEAFPNRTTYHNSAATLAESGLKHRATLFVRQL